VGALLVFDEVQCGLGRTGELWAHMASDIAPDMMTLAKPLAGGLPIGAALVTERVAATIGPGDHGSTFAGGPLITAAACYVFDRVSAPEFLAHVNEIGAYLHERLEEINSPHVKEVRGRGLMLGVQLDTDASEVVKKGYAHHILTVNAGPDVIRLVPPLILQRADCDTFIERFSAALAEV
jgi:acetylornithine/succinyldiaminopimelate/putrescine aminotransferase